MTRDLVVPREWLQEIHVPSFVFSIDIFEIVQNNQNRMLSEIRCQLIQIHLQVQRGANFAEELREIELWNIQSSALHPTGRLDELAIIFCVACFNLTHLTFGGVVEIIRIRIVPSDLSIR